MKYERVYALFLVFFHSSCGQHSTNTSKDNIKSEAKDINKSDFGIGIPGGDRLFRKLKYILIKLFYKASCYKDF